MGKEKECHLRRRKFSPLLFLIRLFLPILGIAGLLSPSSTDESLNAMYVYMYILICIDIHVLGRKWQEETRGFSLYLSLIDWLTD